MSSGAGRVAPQAVLLSILSAFGLYYLAIRSEHAAQQPESSGKIPQAQVPICGRLNDGKVHIPQDWTSLLPPPIGQSYVDPTFGCPVKRLTNGSIEETLGDGTHPSLMNYYSTLSPISADDTKLLIFSNGGTWRVKDASGRVVVPSDKMPAMNDGHPVWDAADGSVFYYTRGKSLYQATIKGNSIKSLELQAFKEYKGINSPDAADLSQDGDHIALMGQNANDTMDIFVWSLSKKAKTSSYTTTCKINGDITGTPQPGCMHKLLLIPSNLLAIAFANDGADPEQGARLWDGSKLVHLQDRTNHLDTGFDLDGTPVYIESGNIHYTPGIKNPCPSGWGLDVRKLNDTSSSVCLLDKLPSWHVSYRGSASQPWAVLSFMDGRKGGGPELFRSNPGFQEPSSDNWGLYEDEIILAHIDGNAIYRLAHARSRSAENYWAEPHAAISRDGKYLVFSSNMAYPNGCPSRMHVANECMDVYLIQVH